MVDCARGEEDPAHTMERVALEVAFKVGTISSDEMTSPIFLPCIVPFTLVLDQVPSGGVIECLTWVVLAGVRHSQVCKLEGLQLLMPLLYGLTCLFDQFLGERKSCCLRSFRCFRSRLLGRLHLGLLPRYSSFGVSLILGLSFSLCDSTSNSHRYILFGLNSLIIFTLLLLFNFGEVFIICSLASVSGDILYCYRVDLRRLVLVRSVSIALRSLLFYLLILRKNETFVPFHDVSFSWTYHDSTDFIDSVLCLLSIVCTALVPHCVVLCSHSLKYLIKYRLKLFK